MTPKSSLKYRLLKLAREERAAEVTELAIVLALMVAGSVAIILLIGPKVKAGYTAVDNQVP